MRAKITVTLVLVAVVAGVIWLLSDRHSSRDGFDRTQNALPSKTKKVLNTAERFLLLSLDPEATEKDGTQPKETFHQYAVLGKTEIRDAGARSELLRALYKGIADSDGLVAACFNPRHGISATLGDETVDLVICFECGSIKTHAKAGRSVLTTSSPEQTFNHALATAGLPISKHQ
jgi:hypothetical protein